MRWSNKIYSLPENPLTGKAVILTPRSFILDIPTISADNFADFIWQRKNQDLRDQFSFLLKSELNKGEIIRIAIEKREWVDEFEKFVSKQSTLKAYDLTSDPRGAYIPAKESVLYAQKQNVRLRATDDASFQIFVDTVIKEYSKFIENNNGYKLLWNDDRSPRTEEAAQIMFTCVVKHFCKSNNIDLSKETNLGRGPVDFKFSSGYKNRASIEIKLAKNSKFWNGVKLQLPKYLEVEDIETGYFIVICFNDDDLEKVNTLSVVAEKISKKIKRDIIPVIIDASLDKLSASKL